MERQPGYGTFESVDAPRGAAVRDLRSDVAVGILDPLFRSWKERIDDAVATSPEVASQAELPKGPWSRPGKPMSS